MIAEHPNPNMKIVRCWEQHLRHGRPWETPAGRCMVFHDRAASDQWEEPPSQVTIVEITSDDDDSGDGVPESTCDDWEHV